VRVLLLNPPSRPIAIRDYYCSKHTKSNYLFPPLDLLAQSGILAPRHELSALDAVARRLDANACLAAIAARRPEAVLGLWGAATDRADGAFYAELAARVPAPIYISGEVVLDQPAQWLADHPYVRGALLRFISGGLLAHLDGGSGGPDLMVRADGGISGGLDPDPPAEFSLGRPRHELFGHEGYHFSFARGRRFATTVTDFGCPFKCRFCVMSGLGYRLRPIAEVVEEWRWLRGWGVDELFVSDQCFGARRERSLALCAALAKAAPGMGWTTFTRADLLDDELLTAMKDAGCHTLIMGVESASQETLRAYAKGLAPEKVAAGFRLCRQRGVRTVATFIVGLPEDTEESLRASMRLARELDPDYVSYNVAVPRAGTALRELALAEGLLESGVDPDQAGDCVALRTRTLARAEVARLKKTAVRDFYLRPGYLWRRLRAVRSLPEFLAEAGEGLALLGKNL
jgi:anaerobic magnesium-protoporphyrin IX monomethyl ester cyclase